MPGRGRGGAGLKGPEWGAGPGPSAVGEVTGAAELLYPRDFNRVANPNPLLRLDLLVTRGSQELPWQATVL